MKKLKVLGIAACALALAAFVLAGCSGQSASKPAESNNNASNEPAEETFKLIVGFDQEFPPYGYIGDDGQFAGVDLDLAKEVAAYNNWEIELLPIDWDSKDAMLDAGTINCIWNGFTMEGRETDYTFSEPYMLNSQVLVTKAGSEITSIEDCVGKVVMTQTGSAGLDCLNSDDYAAITANFAGGEPQTLADYNNIFMQLDSGMVDAVVCDSSYYAVQNLANPDKYVIAQELLNEHFAVGFKKGEDELAKTVSDTLKTLYGNGTVATVLEKYPDIDPDNWILI